MNITGKIAPDSKLVIDGKPWVVQNVEVGKDGTVDITLIEIPEPKMITITSSFIRNPFYDNQ